MVSLLQCTPRGAKVILLAGCRPACTPSNKIRLVSIGAERLNYRLWLKSKAQIAKPAKTALSQMTFICGFCMELPAPPTHPLPFRGEMKHERERVFLKLLIPERADISPRKRPPRFLPSNTTCMDFCGQKDVEGSAGWGKMVVSD